MRFDTLRHDQITTDPHNVRRHFSDGELGRLAESIGEYGLLENLVVRESDEGGYWLVAGERRWRAIGILITQNRWDEREPVPVLIVDDQNHEFVNLVENLHRADVKPWELGRRFNELVESGYTQSEIASRIGDRSTAYVGRHIKVAQGLHPATIRALNKISMNVPFAQLMKLSALLDADKKPDEKAQLQELKHITGQRRRGKRKRAPRTDTQRAMRRLRHLKDEMRVPTHALPYVKTIVSYLMGETSRPVFPEEL